MKTQMVFSLGLSALVMAGSIAGVSAIASASDRSGPAAMKAAAEQAARALKALDRGKADDAVRYAEASVALLPRDADYRMILGRSYLQAGRFASARAAFTDVLALTPGNGRAALNLSLAQTATGDWAAARTTLDANAAVIPAGDLGLAMALAGNPTGAVALLTTAARQPGATAKVRQNLALALALTGQWNAARVAAAADLSPAEVDARIEQWAAFAQPHSSSDQVAALLGVKAANDSGLPIALALNGTVPMTAAVEQVAAAVPVPAPSAAPVTAAVIATAPVEAPAPAPMQPLLAKVVFGPVREVVQPTPVATIDPAAAPAKVAADKAIVASPFVAKPTAFARGDWVVQLGAYHSAGIARDGWARIASRYTGLRGHSPTGASFANKAGSFYRLSVGGLVRGDADRLCQGIRARGGACFVRKVAGDRMAQWLRKPGLQLASR